MRPPRWAERAGRAARAALGAGLLLWQGASVLGVPGLSTPLLAWGPLHEQVRYRVEVELPGGRLTPDAVAQRYGLSRRFTDARGEDWELNRLSDVLEGIALYERTRGAGDGARVRVRFRRNGGAEELWQWPAPGEDAR